MPASVHSSVWNVPTACEQGLTPAPAQLSAQEPSCKADVGSIPAKTHQASDPHSRETAHGARYNALPHAKPVGRAREERARAQRHAPRVDKAALTESAVVVTVPSARQQLSGLVDERGVVEPARRRRRAVRGGKLDPKQPLEPGGLTSGQLAADGASGGRCPETHALCHRRARLADVEEAGGAVGVRDVARVVEPAHDLSEEVGRERVDRSPRLHLFVAFPSVLIPGSNLRFGI